MTRRSPLVRLFLSASAMLLCLQPVHAYTIAPEVFWFTITQDGQRIGFGRGEYLAVNASTYQCKTVLVMHLPTSQEGELGDYRFDSNLKPLSFSHKTLYTNQTQSVTNTEEANFDWAKGNVDYKKVEFEKETKANVPVVAGAVSLFTINIALAHSPLAAGQRTDFLVFSPQVRRFVKQHVEILTRDKATGQFHVRLVGEDNPDVPRTFWFLPSTPKHPNGYITLTTFRQEGHDFRFQAAPRAQAIRGFSDVVTKMGI